MATTPLYMASTIWKGQLTFGLVSFPVRLQKSARRERIALKYVRETQEGAAAESVALEAGEGTEEQRKMPDEVTARDLAPFQSQGQIIPVRKGYFSEGQRE